MRAILIWTAVSLFFFSQCTLLKRKPPFVKEMEEAAKLYQEKKYAEALQHYLKALEHKASDPDALLGLAKTHLALENIPAARSTLEKILSISPSSAQAQEAKSLLKTMPEGKLPPKEVAKQLKDLLEGRKLEGIEVPKVTPETAAQAFSFFQRGVGAFQRGKIDFAIALFQKAEELNPAFPATYVALGAAYMKKGMFNQAISQLRQALQLDPLNVEARFNLALIYEGRGLWELARNEYMQVLPLNVNNPLIYTRLGLIYMELGLPSAALDAWRIASTIDPHFFPARLLLAKAYADVGQAFYVPVEYSLSYDPSTHTVNVTRSPATAPVSITFYDAAINEYREVLHENPRSAEAHYGLGTTLARAVQTLTPVFYFDGRDHRDPYNGQLKAKMSPQEMLLQAIQHLRQAVKLDPGNVIYRTNLGIVYAEAGFYKEALFHIKTAIKLDRAFLSARGVLGVLLSYLGQLAPSQAQYQGLGKAHPDLIRAMEALDSLQKVKVPESPLLPSKTASAAAATQATPFSAPSGATTPAPSPGAPLPPGSPAQTPQPLPSSP